MIHCDLDLFHEVFNTINQCYQKQIHFLSLILLSLLDLFVKEIQRVLMISFVSSHIIISILLLLKCILRVPLDYLEDIKLIVIAN